MIVTMINHRLRVAIALLAPTLTVALIAPALAAGSKPRFVIDRAYNIGAEQGLSYVTLVANVGARTSRSAARTARSVRSTCALGVRCRSRLSQILQRVFR
jgi:hypothetical protein